MTKISVPKEVRDKLQVLYMDKDFHARSLNRITQETNAVIMMELQRTGNLGREVTHIDLDNGTLDVNDIIKSKQPAPKIVAAKK